MNKDVSLLAVIVSPDEPIDRVVRRMAAESRAVSHAGLAVVLGSNGEVLGLVTDGDIRRAYARDISWFEPVSKIMISQPVTLPIGMHSDEIILELSRRVENAPHLNAKTIRHILLVDERNRLVDISDFVELLWDREERSARVHVIGMGFVGLTVAISLASVGHRVTGVDLNTDLLSNLRNGDAPIHELGLTSKLQHLLERDMLQFESSLERSRSSIYIIAVGTPVSDSNQADLSGLRLVAKQVSTVLKPGDQVMLRSTVPVGTTRRLLLPILENDSRLRVAEEFNLTFAPERTLAGRALIELRTLPQLVGGITLRCTERASQFWATLTHTVARLPNPESAELAKLANNCFRNVSFAFANELASLAEEHNLDVSEVIQAANNGYPRNPIPLASPGVGGYCLPKDSILLSASFSEPNNVPRLSSVARVVNDRMASYPIRVVKRFCKAIDKPEHSMKILVVGIAFKGEPETNDMRGSVGVHVARELSNLNMGVCVWDAVVRPTEISAIGLTPVKDKDEAVSGVDVVLVMNNHRENSTINITTLSQQGRPRLIFDGWGLFDREDTEAIDSVYYSCLGYCSSI